MQQINSSIQTIGYHFIIAIKQIQSAGTLNKLKELYSVFEKLLIENMKKLQNQK